MASAVRSSPVSFGEENFVVRAEVGVVLGPRYGEDGIRIPNCSEEEEEGLGVAENWVCSRSLAIWSGWAR